MTSTPRIGLSLALTLTLLGAGTARAVTPASPKYTTAKWWGPLVRKFEVSSADHRDALREELRARVAERVGDTRLGLVRLMRRLKSGLRLGAAGRGLVLLDEAAAHIKLARSTSVLEAQPHLERAQRLLARVEKLRFIRLGLKPTWVAHRASDYGRPYFDLIPKELLR